MDKGKTALVKKWNFLSFSQLLVDKSRAAYMEMWNTGLLSLNLAEKGRTKSIELKAFKKVGVKFYYIFL